MHSSYIAVIDFGSQTTMLIARRLRELGVLAKVLPASVSSEDFKAFSPAAIVLSGGPASLVGEKTLRVNPGIFGMNVPILGICYGMQLIADHFGGSIKRAQEAEFGQRKIEVDNRSLLFDGLPASLQVWMSHFDQIEIADGDFSTIAHSATCPQVAIECPLRKIFGV